jgi:hypothetical protein
VSGKGAERSPGERAERLAKCELDAWTNADASEWWRSHNLDTPIARQSKSAGSHTIMVDLARRTP